MEKKDYLEEEIKRLSRINEKLEERLDTRIAEYPTLCKVISENASTICELVEAM